MSTMLHLERPDPDRARIYAYSSLGSSAVVAAATWQAWRGGGDHVTAVVVACVVMQAARVGLNVAPLLGAARVPKRHRQLASCVHNSAISIAIGHITGWPTAALLLLPFHLLALQSLSEDTRWRRQIGRASCRE